MPSAMIFADVLPGTTAAGLIGLGSAIVLRDPSESRPPGAALWRGGAPGRARAGDGVLLELSEEAAAGDARRRGLRVWAICRHPADVAEAADRGLALWLRGMEAGGRCGLNTALVLMRALPHTGTLWVAEGLTRGARAASLAVGAAGVVVGPSLWGAPGSPLPPDVVSQLSALDLRKVETRGGPRTGERWALSDPEIPAAASLCELSATEQPVADLIRQERRALHAHRALISAHHPLRRECDPLGTGVPIVQGPMANVAEDRPLAQAVSRAGGLPFVALGALDPAQAAAVLDRADSVDGLVGAGLIAFDIAPYRQAHLDALRQRRPRPVIVAGGSIPLARSLTEDGFEAWLHTPSPRLAGLALAAGVPAVVLEGHEAGGHVGPLSSTYLWDHGLQAAVQSVDSGRADSPLVVLAGGIGDAISAAFCAALAAPACAAGVRVALQVGTAFFCTHEIAEQLTPACRQRLLDTQDTVLVGATVNLPLRCAPNAFTDQAIAQEQAWLDEAVPLRERRHRMEAQNLGRTRMAAKGIERNDAWNGDSSSERYRAVPEDRLRREAAFTLGQGAIVTGQTRTVAALIEELTAGARHRLAPRSPWGEVASVAGEPSAFAAPIEVVRPLARDGRAPTSGRNIEQGAPIAIVGLGCVLPGAADVLAFWRGQIRAADAIGPIPRERWDPERYHHPEAGSHGPALSRSIAAAVAASTPFDPLRYRIPPRILPTVDRSQRLALLAGDEAAADAGWLAGALDPTRAAVVLGNAMGGEWRSKIGVRVRFREVVDALVAEGHLSADARAAIEPGLEARLDRELLPIRPESMVGLLGNLVAARLASWLDWRGGTHTVDAACAASLVAVAQAVDLLRDGRVDAVLCGGVDTDLSPDTYVGFSRTLALSSAGSRPFSTAADGFVMGEGGAVFALQRLDQALADGRPIWGVIRGVGIASDGRGRGLTAPLPDGQRLAIGRAWNDAGLDPHSAAYIEAHGTGTTLGDRTEATVITELFAQSTAGPWVGTAKGSLGHLKSGAGAAGLLRAVLSVATGVVLPTLHAGDPIDEASALRLPRRPTRPAAGVVRAGVSAFGFGGTNAHVVVEAPPDGANVPELVRRLRDEAEPFLVPEAEARWTATHPASPPALTPSPTLLCFAAPTVDALADALESRNLADPLTTPDGHRAALLVTGEDRVFRARVAAYLREEGPDPGLGRRVWLGEGTAETIAVLCPGQGAQRAEAVASVARFAAAKSTLHAMRDQFKTDLSAGSSSDTRDLHRALFAVGAAWVAVLEAAGITADFAVGHSLGEWTALVAADEVDATTLAPLVQARGEALHTAPAGGMLAVIGEPDAAEAFGRDLGLVVAAYNSPRATILAGPADAIDAALRAGGSPRTVRVPVDHAFHSPAMAPAAQALQAIADRLPAGPSTRWISAATAQPGNPSHDLIDAITAPVRFVDALARLPAEALLVELGPGAVLTGHARAAGRRAIALDPDPQHNPHGVHAAASALWAAGHPGLIRILPDLHLPAPSHRREVGPAATIAAEPVAESRPQAPISNALPLRRQAAAAANRDLRHTVLAAVMEVTGYPEEALLSATDLQRDLGVDSIQRLEVMGLLQEQLTLSVSDDDIAAIEAMTIDSLVALIARSGERPAPDAAPVRAWVHRYAWHPVNAAAQPPPAEGWTRRGNRWCWRGPATGDPVDATLAALHAAREAPSEPGDWVLWVPDTPAGRAAAAALRCAAAEAGRDAVVVRDRGHGAWPEPFPPASVIRVGAATEVLRWRPVLDTPAGPADAVLATGGVRGIVVPCLVALRPKRAWLTGRTAPDNADVSAALESLRAAGIEASYHRCDLTESAQVEALAAVAEPDLILHGAGLLRDRPVADLTKEDVQAVFAVKLDGLRHLRDRFANARLVAFSSVTAHVGNKGQLAYAAANAAIECLADGALAFTAWADRGMAASPAVQAAMRLAGVRPLPLDLGVQTFVDSVHRPGTSLITTAPPPHAEPLPWPATHLRPHAGGATVGLRLDPADPRLADHIVGGRALVPAATWVDLVLAITHQLGADLAVNGLEVHAPCVVAALRHDVTLHLDLEGARAKVCTPSAALATATLSAAGPSPGRLSAPGTDSAASGLYRPDLLFHGPRWQVLYRFGSDGNGTVSAELSAQDRAGVIDGAHQLLAVWAAKDRGWTGLPVGAARWTAFAGDDPVRVCAWCEIHDDDVLGRVQAVDASGRVVLAGEGVRLRRARDLSADLVAYLRGLA